MSLPKEVSETNSATVLAVSSASLTHSTSKTLGEVCPHFLPLDLVSEMWQLLLVCTHCQILTFSFSPVAYRRMLGDLVPRLIVRWDFL